MANVDENRGIWRRRRVGTGANYLTPVSTCETLSQKRDPFANAPALSVPPFYQVQHTVLNTNRSICACAYTTRIDALGSSAISHSRWLAAAGLGLGSDSGFHLGERNKCKLSTLRRNAPPYTSGKASDLKHVFYSINSAFS